MKKIILGTKIGLKTGAGSLIAYGLINTTLNNLSNIIFWRASFSDVIEGSIIDFYNHSIFLVIPFTIICTVAGIIFALIIVTNRNTSEKTVTTICTIICLIIASILFYFTRGMIYNSDDEAMSIANLEFRTIPYTLFVVWGYFVSRLIYRTVKQLPDAEPTSS